jgi:thiamine transport system permease protein
MAGFIIAPLLGMLISSFRVHHSDGFVWSLEGWGAAWVTTALISALLWSLAYALLTLMISLPLGYLLAEIIYSYEQRGRNKTGLIIDVLVMLPIALSAVMVGLGVLIGLLRTEVEILHSWWIPAYGHVMMTTPFVVRIILPSIRSIDPDLNAAAALLGASPIHRLISIRLPLLAPSIIVASSLVVAISLGEFGASWVVVRFTEWTTLPVMIDDLLTKPGYNPLLRPAANAAGVVLMLLTMLLFMTVERFRPIGRGGEF